MGPHLAAVAAAVRTARFGFAIALLLTLTRAAAAETWSGAGHTLVVYRTPAGQTQWKLMGPGLSCLQLWSDGHGVSYLNLKATGIRAEDIRLAAGRTVCIVQCLNGERRVETECREGRPVVEMYEAAQRRLYINGIPTLAVNVPGQASIDIQHRFELPSAPCEDARSAPLWRCTPRLSVSQAVEATRAVSWRVRLDAVESLGSGGDPTALPLLERLCHDPHPLVRVIAFRAALRVAFDTAQPQALQRLTHTVAELPEGPALQLLLADALRAWSAADRAVPLSAWCALRGLPRLVAVEAVLASPAVRELDCLDVLLADPNGLVRARAVEALARLKTPQAAARALTALRTDTHPQVRWTALIALWDEHPEGMEPALLATAAWAEARGDGDLARLCRDERARRARAQRRSGGGV